MKANSRTRPGIMNVNSIFLLLLLFKNLSAYNTLYRSVLFWDSQFDGLEKMEELLPFWVTEVFVIIHPRMPLSQHDRTEISVIPSYR